MRGVRSIKTKMKVNGHNLPNTFVEAINKNIFYREVGSWPLKKDCDSFGNHIKIELGQVFTSLKEITEEINQLNKDFSPDGIYGTESEWKQEPGFIEDITDITKIVAFAIAGDGSPFCFDFRESKESPKIIWWDDCYWRVISQNFEEFLKLFELNS